MSVSTAGWRAAAVALVLSAAVAAELAIDEALIAMIEQGYGEAAGGRMRDWRTLLDNARSLPELEKLEQVNAFFNQVAFVDDRIHWNAEDYWATPVEFLATNGGDCEDFAIAKYFTLVEIGVPEERLRLTYVTAVEYRQPHMVLTYFETPRATPLVLDNLNPAILPATERKDLVPVYSFNATGLWIAKSIGSGKQVGSADRLDLWRDLTRRLQTQPGAK